MTIAEKIARAKADYDEVFEAGKKSVLSVLDFTDIESNTYRSTVPSGADDFARVNKIGGMSHKTKNLIRFPYDETLATRNGITFTSNSDGSVTLNGTNNGEGHSSFHFAKITNPIHLKAGTYIGSTGNTAIGLTGYDGTNYYSFTSENPKLSTDVDLNIYIQVNKRTTTAFNNLTIYPMLNEGTTALPFEPYFEGLRSASVSELKSEGANLFNTDSYAYTSMGSSITRHSVSNGTLKVFLSKQSADNGWHYVECENMFPIGNMETVYASATIKRNELTRSLFRIDIYDNINKKRAKALKEIWYESDGRASSGAVTIPQEYRNEGYSLRLAFYANAGQSSSADAYVEYSDIMLSATTDAYLTYKGLIDTLPIPEAVKSLDGYGLGANSEYYNYIDFDRKVFVQNVYRKVFDGTEAWSTQVLPSGNYRLNHNLDEPSIPCPAEHIAPLICSHYSILSGNDVWNSNVGAAISTGGGAFYVYDAEYGISDTSIWKAHLAELYASGNPLTIVYALAVPIETDISSYLTDEYIEVEGGGTVTVVNENQLDAPTNISYLIDTQGG